MDCATIETRGVNQLIFFTDAVRLTRQGNSYLFLGDGARLLDARTLFQALGAFSWWNPSTDSYLEVWLYRHRMDYFRSNRDAGAILRDSDDFRADCQFCQFYVHYGGNRVWPSARTRQDNRPKYGG
jgi:hypothetical protein